MGLFDRRIGGLYKGGPVTDLDVRLFGTFGLSSFPGLVFRVHPDCDGLICADGEIVVQVGRGGEWLDFIREQQSAVLRYVC